MLKNGRAVFAIGFVGVRVMRDLSWEDFDFIGLRHFKQRMHSTVAVAVGSWDIRESRD